MISFAGQRSEIAKKIIDAITKREWGFMLLDEVRVGFVALQLLLQLNFSCFGFIFRTVLFSVLVHFRTAHGMAWYDMVWYGTVL